jgi:hypothetical protein
MPARGLEAVVAEGAAVQARRPEHAGESRRHVTHGGGLEGGGAAAVLALIERLRAENAHHAPAGGLRNPP